MDVCRYQTEDSMQSTWQKFKKKKQYQSNSINTLGHFPTNTWHYSVNNLFAHSNLKFKALWRRMISKAASEIMNTLNTSSKLIGTIVLRIQNCHSTPTRRVGTLSLKIGPYAELEIFFCILSGIVPPSYFLTLKERKHPDHIFCTLKQNLLPLPLH